MEKSQHYWRINARVARRVWTDCPGYIRDIIANDVLHVTEVYKWFVKKVEDDTNHLYLDENYYDNAPNTFMYPR